MLLEYKVRFNLMTCNWQPDVNISFYNHKTTDWISITGKAKVINDKEKVKALFSSLSCQSV